MRFPILLATLALAAGSVQAQELTHGNLSLTFSTLDGDSGADLDTFNIEGSAGYQFGNFDIFGDVDFFDFSDDLGGTEILLFQIGAGYSFGDFRIDGSFANLDIDDDVLGIGVTPDADGDIFEIGVGYASGPWEVRAAYAFFDQGVIGVDDLYGVAVGYKFSESFEASISVHEADGIEGAALNDTIVIIDATYDGGNWQVSGDYIHFDNMDAFNIDGAYGFGNGFGATASVSYIDDEIDDATRYSVGGYYQISDRVRVDAEYFEFDDFRGDDFDGVAVAISFDVGRKGVAQQTQLDRVTNSLTDVLGLNF
ncbi:MAG: porin [Pseudomonadota bacterium]